MGSELTPKQEAFCIAYIEGGNATQAYKDSYSTKGMAPASINRKAKELIDNGKITARLAEIRKPAIERAQITLECHLNDLKRLRDLAEADKMYSAAVTAETNRGKVSGLYVEKIDHTGLKIPQIVINRP